MKLYSRQYSDTGEPLIILHGLFGNQGNWAWHARELSSDYAVHAMDLRNHGRSDWHADHDYQSMAQDVLDTMEDLGLDSAHVMGHSMGGKVAMQLALTAPQRVRRLILVEIAPADYPQETFPPLDAMLAIPLEEITSREEADAVMAKYIETDAIRDFLLTNLQRDEDGHFHWRCNLQVIADSFPQIRARPPAEGSFKGATLFIKGGLSHYIAEEHRQAIAELFPAAGLKVIARAGHWVHSEKPRAFLKIIRDFLQATPEA